MENNKKPMQKFMDMIMPSCEIISYKISESMDHDLPMADKVRIRMHVMMCNLCARYRDQLLVLRNIIDKYYTDDVLVDESGMEVHLSESARKKMIEKLTKQ